MQWFNHNGSTAVQEKFLTQRHAFVILIDCDPLLHFCTVYYLKPS